MAKGEQDMDMSATAVPVREDAPVAIPIGQMTGLEDLVRTLEELVRGARNMPLSSSALVDRKELLDVVEMLKRSIPEEVARARTVIRDRDDVIERARAERESLLSKTEIVQAASREADRMVAEAEAVARRIRAEAEEYVEGKLATFEVVLQKTLAAVERGRARLAGRLDADSLADDQLDQG